MEGSTSGTDVDESLFKAIIGGSPWQKLSAGLGNVDPGNQRLLMQSAIMYGRLDSVVWLLVKGLDPAIVCGDDSFVLDMAELWQSRFPDEEERRGIATLLKAVRGSVSWQNGDSGVVTTTESGPGGANETVDAFLGEILHILSHLSSKIDAADELIKNLTGEVQSLNFRMLRRQPAAYRIRIKKICPSSARCITNLGAEVSLRDEGLNVLEGKAYMLLEEIRTLKHFADDVRSTLNSMMQGWGVLSESELLFGNILSVGGGVCLRYYCVQELLRRTELLKRNDQTAASVEDFYGRLHDMSLLTRCILRYLQLKTEVQFVIDFDSYYIGNVKSTIVNLAGTQCQGGSRYSFADFREKIVYLGGKTSSSWSVERVIGQFIMSLAQMSFYLAFRNEGRPYVSSDSGSRVECNKAMAEAKDGWSIEDSQFDNKIKDLLSGEFELGMQVCLVAAVPGMVATFGSVDGVLRARRKMRALTNFYEYQVMPKLWREVEVSSLP